LRLGDLGGAALDDDEALPRGGKLLGELLADAAVAADDGVA
jgi:hypothetical protein